MAADDIPTPALELVQLGDLHLGADADVAGWFDAVIAWLDANRHDAVVFVGDLTEDGTTEQFTQAWTLLGRLAQRREPLSFCFGNHDLEAGIPDIPEQLAGAYLRTLELGAATVVVTETSRVGERNGAVDLAALDDQLRALPAACRIVAAHHHLVPAPRTLFQHEVLAEAGDVLALLAEHDVALWLNGHKHRSHAARLDDLVLSTSGSPRPSKARPAPLTPEFNLIRITDDELRIDAIDPVAGTRRTLLQTARSQR